MYLRNPRIPTICRQRCNHGWIRSALILLSIAVARESVLAQDASQEISSQETTAQPAAAISFRSEIAPILFDRCLPCHGTKKAEGGYRLDTYDELLKAGDSEMMPVVAGNAQQSELLRRLNCDESERMPADDTPLTEQQIALINGWIAAGADFDGAEEQRGLSLNLVIPALQYPAPPEHYAAAMPATAVCFTPDGSQLVVAGYHEVTVWNEATLARRIGNVGERTYALAFSPDGKLLAIGGGEPGKRGEVRLFNFESGEMLAMVARANDVVLDVAFRPDGRQLAVAAADGQIRIIDADSRDEVAVLSSHADWVTAVSWSGDGTRLASASRDKSAKIYDASNWQLVTSYLGHAAQVRGVVILEDNQQAVSVGADQKLHRWNLSDAARVADVGLGGEAFDVVRHAGFVYVPCADKRLRKIDLSSNAVSHTFEGFSDWVLSVAVNPQRLAGGSYGGEVRLWSTADGSPSGHWLAKP